MSAAILCGCHPVKIKQLSDFSSFVHGFDNDNDKDNDANKAEI